MTYSLLYTVSIFLFTTYLCAPASTSDDVYLKTYIQCLKSHSNSSNSISKVIYAPNNSSYKPVLQFSINNLRFMTPETPNPILIVTPTDESQIQAVVLCSNKHGLLIRTRSGGHDFEGQSYVAQTPFVLLDMINHRKIKVDTEKGTAWVESGATIGELYFRIAEKSKTLGFPGGLWTNVGVGGFISGGGYGMMKRKYGLAADNVIDARLINVNAKVLDRKTMGQDLFWAIRGGGASSFGVILSWMVKLVHVPEIVTVFRIARTLEENATNIFYRWQYVAPRFPKNLDLKCYAQSVVSNASTREDNRTVQITFESLYLGDKARLFSLIQHRFPELGLQIEDCLEVSWIESAPFFTEYPVGTSPDILLNRTALPKFNFKGKSDFAHNIIPKDGLMGIWDMLFNVPPKTAVLHFTPYGGRMNEISAAATPFPHRAGTLYMIYMGIFLDNDTTQRLRWINRLYDYLRPYVSKNPRAAYLNYLDLDLGVHNSHSGQSSYAQASKWGKMYFKNNFQKLMQVKSVVDPDNFFRHEQSIPILS